MPRQTLKRSNARYAKRQSYILRRMWGQTPCERIKTNHTIYCNRRIYHEKENSPPCLTDGGSYLGQYPDRLRRRISILLDNAGKYGAEGGHITLTREKTDRQARLTVSNPGDPIPPEHLAHLFERFYRADASRGEKSGFGSGLAIADTIAREHKGVLKAESDTASTRLTFTMPLKQ